jgi:Saccharopine dehydrogenase NADP binding domain
MTGQWDDCLNDTTMVMMMMMVIASSRRLGGGGHGSRRFPIRYSSSFIVVLKTVAVGGFLAWVQVCWSLSPSSSSSSIPQRPLPTSLSSSKAPNHDDDTSKRKNHRFVLLGGTGKIGMAVANHLLLREPNSDIVLVGRRQDACQEAVKHLLLLQSKKQATHTGHGAKVSFAVVKDIWDESDAKLQDLMTNTDCVIHTAGPYHDRPTPVPLKLAIAAGCCKAYVDVSDPLDFLRASLDLNETAGTTTALVAAGAFPGMSNVLAMEAAAAFQRKSNINNKNDHQEEEAIVVVHDCRFNYFTAGLGGSGAVNLFITNLGFGQSMAQYDNGHLQFIPNLSGLLLGTVNFFLPSESIISPRAAAAAGNEAARRRIGTRQVFAWPFPEAATVAQELKIRGASHAAMGTAPDAWNIMLDILVRVSVPRSWWRNERFSKFMADFSQPLVQWTDKLLKWSDEAKVGETHAMRIDISGNRASHGDGDGDMMSGSSTCGVSIVQAHDSFRQCVGQSCAEFALDCLEHPAPGVYLPEQRYRDETARTRIIQRLTSTPGTFCYTGPVQLNHMPPPPTRLDQALAEAERKSRG